MSIDLLTLQRPEIYDEYTRRQYLSKAPERNPFGVDDEPVKFEDFDVFTKVLYHATINTYSADMPTLDSSFTTADAVDDGKPRPYSRTNGRTKG